MATHDLFCARLDDSMLDRRHRLAVLSMRRARAAIKASLAPVPGSVAFAFEVRVMCRIQTSGGRGQVLLLAPNLPAARRC